MQRTGLTKIVGIEIPVYLLEFQIPQAVSIQ